MADEGASILPPSQLRVIERGSAVAGLAGGVVGFGVTGLLLLDVMPLTTRGDLVAWSLPLALWAVSWVPSWRTWRAPMQVAALVLLLVMPILPSIVATPGDGIVVSSAWIPVTAVAFAAAVVAAFTLAWRAALLTVVTCSVLDAWLTITRPPMTLTLDREFAAGLAGPLLTLICGSLLVLVHDRWLHVARAMDADVALLAQLQDVNEREAHLLHVRAAIDRHIHETVLNTLTALSRPGGSSDAADVAAACRRDLRELEEGLRPWTPTTVSQLVADSIATVNATRGSGVPELICPSSITADPLLAAASAGAVRDAIVECLRNVQRHSGVQRASVTSDETEDPTSGAPVLALTIEDAGVGLSSNVAERFGVRQGIRGALAAVGGDVLIESQPGFGTRITLRLPIGAVTRGPLPDITVDGAIERSLAGRIGLMCTPIFAAVMALPMGLDLGWGSPLPWLMLTSALVNLALAWWWNTRARIPLGIAVLGVIGVTMIVGRASAITLGPAACNAAPGLVWLESAMVGGGMLLALLAFRWAVVRLVVLLYGIGLGGALVLALPAACADDALTPLVTSTVYLVLIVLVVDWGQRRFERGLRLALQVRGRVLAERLETDAQAARIAGWARLNDDIVPLLAGVADGHLQVDDPAVRARASAEAAALRAVLGREPAHRGPTTHLVASMMEIAVHAECTIDAEVISATSRQDLLPVAVQNMVMSLVLACSSHVISLRVLVDELCEEYLLSLPAASLDQVRSQIEGLGPQVDDCRIEIYFGEDDIARVSVRRPLVDVRVEQSR